jgi:hypothetical protein
MGGLELFSYVDLEDRVPAQHPLRAICSIVNEVLAAVRSASGPDRPTLVARDGSLRARPARQGGR